MLMALALGKVEKKQEEASTAIDGSVTKQIDEKQSKTKTTGTALVRLREAAKAIKEEQPEERFVLVAVRAAEQALAEAVEPADVKEVRDRAGALEDYIRRWKKDLRNSNAMASVRLRCERKLGEHLKATVTRGSQKNKIPAGITADQSSAWQKLAKINPQVFDRLLQEKIETEELSTKAMIRWGAGVLSNGTRGGGSSNGFWVNDKGVTVQELCKHIPQFSTVFPNACNNHVVARISLSKPKTEKPAASAFQQKKKPGRPRKAK